MLGTVGVPLPGVDMRLEAVPELGYLPNDPRTPKGEVRICSTMSSGHSWSLHQPLTLCMLLESLQLLVRALVRIEHAACR